MFEINNGAEIDAVRYNEVLRRLEQNGPDLNIDQTEEELSFEKHIVDTEAYREYCKKKKPQNRRNALSPESDGRCSDYDMEFTRIRGSLTPSVPSSFSVSSVGAVSVPTIGNIQLHGTPTSPKTPPRKQRKSAIFTPSAMVRNKFKSNVANQIAASQIAASKSSNLRNVYTPRRSNSFAPGAASTPIALRNQSNRIENHDQAKLDKVDSSDEKDKENVADVADNAVSTSNGTNNVLFDRPASPLIQQENDNNQEMSAAALQFHETDISIQNVIVPSTQEVIPETQESQEADKSDIPNESDDKTIVVPETEDPDEDDGNVGEATLTGNDRNASLKAPVAGSSALPILNGTTNRNEILNETSNKVPNLNGSTHRTPINNKSSMITPNMNRSNHHIPKANTPNLNRSNINLSSNRVVARPIWNKTEPTHSNSSRLPVPIPKTQSNSQPGASDEPMNNVGKSNKENITVTVNVNMNSPVAKTSNDVTTNHAGTNQIEAQISNQPNESEALNGDENNSNTNSLLTDDDEPIEFQNISNKTPNRSLCNTSAKRRLFNVEPSNNVEIDDRTHTIYNATSSRSENVSNRNSSRVRFTSDRFDATKTIATNNQPNHRADVDEQTYFINNATRDISKPSTSNQIDDRTHTINNESKNVSTRQSSRLRLNTDPFITHSIVHAQDSMPIGSRTFNNRRSTQNTTYNEDQNRIDSIQHSFGVPQKNSTLRHSTRHVNEATVEQQYSNFIDGTELPIDGTYNVDNNYDIGNIVDINVAYQTSLRKRSADLIAMLTEDENDVGEPACQPSRNNGSKRTRISNSNEDARGAGFDQHDNQHVSIVHDEDMEQHSKSKHWNPIVKISKLKRSRGQLNQSQVSSTSSEMPSTSSQMASISSKVPPITSQVPSTSTQMLSTSPQMPSTSSQTPPSPSRVSVNSSQKAQSQLQLLQNSPQVPANLRQGTRNSNVRGSIVSPPLEFQDSEIICETSPNRALKLVSLRVQAGRQSLTESILSEPPEKTMPRKRSKILNPQLEVVEETLKQIHQKPRKPKKSLTKTGRRLYSSDMEKNDDSANLDAVDGDSVFKVPTATAPRNSKSVVTNVAAQVQSDTVQHDDSTASADKKARRTNRSRRDGNISRHIRGLDQSNIIQNDTSVDENGLRRSTRKKIILPSLQLEMYKDHFEKIEQQKAKKRGISHNSEKPSAKRTRKSSHDMPKKSINVTSANETRKTVPSKSDHKTSHRSNEVASKPPNVQGTRWCDTYFYRNLCDMAVTEPMFQNENDVDLEYIKSGRRRIEVTFADKIEYLNVNNSVQFGFYPSVSERSRGYIRMMPSEKKPTILNSEDLELAVVVGTMVIKNDGRDCVVEGGDYIIIKKGVEYSIKNGSESIGIIMFKYLD